jgi:hypothetical protein
MPFNPSLNARPCLALQASKVLDCLLQDSAAAAPGSAPTSGSTTAGSTSTSGSIATVWELLALLNAQQLKVVSSSPRFYDLHHTDAPGWLLPEAALDAALQVGCCWQSPGWGSAGLPHVPGAALCWNLHADWQCMLRGRRAEATQQTVAGVAVAGSN